MSIDQKVQFVPFHALNAYMRPDYRLSIVRAVMAAMPSQPADAQTRFHQLTKKYIQIPGFRNSVAAPPALKVKPYASAFEKSAELVAFTLQTWAGLNPQLRAEMAEVLTGRGWEILPAEADRSKLPGFLASWPGGDDFTAINTAYREKYPESQSVEDDISLMAVWIGNRLPYFNDEPGEETA
jgi:hypothetical protein